MENPQKSAKNLASSTHSQIATHVKDKLKIALVSTPLLTVPPASYGGLEMVVADLARELAKIGHNVTVFAPQGSKVEGCRIFEVGLPRLNTFVDWREAEKRMFDACSIELMTGGYDIIHGHNWFGMEYRAKSADPKLHVLHTHHGGLVTEWHAKNALPFRLNMVGISNWMKEVYERQGIPTRTIYNGVNPEKYPLREKKSDRFLFLSRIAFFKNPHTAIQIAKDLGLKLDVAGTTKFAEDARYIEEIKKSCDGEQIRFIGEVSTEEKIELMSNAKALIVPARWGEPFGLHVVESMMAGTTVVAIADGGIKETITIGGYLCRDVDELSDTLANFKPIAPRACRQNALWFSSLQMALKYEKAYIDILYNGKEW